MPTEHKSQTSAKLQIQLTSSITSASWKTSEVSHGGKALLQVCTQCVADDSSVELELYDEKGKKVATAQGKSKNNRSSIELSIDQPVGSILKGLVKLPAHKAELATSSLRVLPALRVTAWEWLDPEGKAITEITDESVVDIIAKVPDMPDGIPCQMSLVFQEQSGKQSVVLCRQVRSQGGKLSLSWIPAFPRDEVEHEDHEQVKPEGRKYKHPQVLARVEFQGNVAKASPMDYASWTAFRFEGVKGKVKLRYPDGREEERELPEDGVVRVKGCGVGAPEVVE